MTHQPINFKEIFKVVLLIVLIALAIKGSFVCWNVFTQNHIILDPMCQPTGDYLPNCPMGQVGEYSAVWKSSTLLLDIILWALMLFCLKSLIKKKNI